MKLTGFVPEVIPIVVITGLACGAATWQIYRCAASPEVVWDKKNNPTPWNNIKEGTQYKLLNINVSR